MTKKFLIFLALIAAWTGSAHSATIPEILSEIASNNPSLQLSSAMNEATEMDLRAENTVGPTSVEYSPFFRNGISGVASSELIVSQEFDFPTLYSQRSRQISLEREALNKRTSAERKEILLECRSLLLNFILLNKLQGIIQSRLTETDSLLSAYEKSLRLGTATILDYNKIRIVRQDLKRELLENESAIQDIISTLTVQNGNKVLRLDGLDYEQDASKLNFASETLSAEIESMIADAPDLQSAEADVKAARHAVSVARNSWLPGITVGYRRNTEIREASNGFLVGLALPLFGNSSRRKAANARLATSTLEQETTRERIKAEMEGYLKRIRNQQATLATYDATLLIETMKLYRKSLEAGQINLTTYYTEITSLYDQLLTRTRLEYELQQTYSLLTANKL